MTSIAIRVVLGFCFLRLAVPAVSAQTLSSPGAGETVRALEHAWTEAEGSKNAKVMDAILDDAVIFVDAKGNLLTKANYLAEILAAVPNQQSVTETIAIHDYGKTAVAVGIYRERGFRGGHPYAVRRRFVDTWTNKAGRWVCIAGAATTLSR
jgi:ketosteroid isomerase-like protein